MTALETYIRQFASLRRAPNAVFPEATRKRAPHKPILLLAVMDLIARGELLSSFIDVRGDLVELNELFAMYWQRVMPSGQESSIAFPFSHLHNEPFWKLMLQPDSKATPVTIKNISTLSQLRKLALGAELDEDLFRYMTNADTRNALREALLRSCFSEEGRAAVEEQILVNAQAYDYSRELEEKAHRPLTREVLAGTRDYRPTVRDQGFRHAIMKAYDKRCALCGVKIITAKEHTVVEAAHIIPWSKSHNDDIRNGMALCKLCHWAFDEGILGVADDYSVLTARQINVEPNMPGLLSTLTGRHIIPPADRDLWPAQEYLTAHRNEWGL